MKRFKVVICDCDGTLVNSELINIRAHVDAMEWLGQPLDAEERNMIPGHSSRDLIPLFLKRRGRVPEDATEHHPDVDVVIQVVRRFYDYTWPRLVELMPHFEETFSELTKCGIWLGIATTNRTRILELFFEKFQAWRFFSFAHVATGDMISKRKPDPEVYLLALEKMGISNKDEVLALEDTPNGVRSAKQAGLTCAAIPNKFSAGGDFSQADYILGSLKDVIDLVLPRANGTSA